MNHSLRIALALPALLFAFNATADQYDPADNVVGGNSSLRQGHPPITRDLVAVGGVADIDWFKVMTGPYSSYEVVMSYIHPNFGIAFNLERLDNAGTTVLQAYRLWYSTDGTTNYARIRHLRWQTTTFSTAVDIVPTIRITGDPANVSTYPYTIQFRETTLYCPRFNNAGTQITVLLMQSSIQGDFTCDYSVHFFNPAGALLGTQTGTFNEQTTPSPMLVLNTSSVPGVGGFSGNARVAHTCGIGGITAKLVALEPATGFSFDTPCSEKDY